MEVKGTGLVSLRAYIKEYHAQDYQTWLNALPKSAKNVFANVITTSGWFSIDEVYYQALKVTAELFYEGNQKQAAYQVGLFSANFDLKGVYKVFLMIATPVALMKASKRIIAMYYRPVDVKIDEVQKNSLVLSSTLLHRESEMIDYLNIAWCVRALELANCKNVDYKKVDPIYEDMFSVQLSWS
ncbi:MAG: hypothetical protein JXR60_06595 [Bacteroidales bacterium]|nr:hypothetical protein [Bacteroidales bacterium]